MDPAGKIIDDADTPVGGPGGHGTLYRFVGDNKLRAVKSGTSATKAHEIQTYYGGKDYKKILESPLCETSVTGCGKLSICSDFTWVDMMSRCRESWRREG